MNPGGETNLAPACPKCGMAGAMWITHSCVPAMQEADVRGRLQRLLDGIHAAVSFTYIDGEEARLRARIALKEAAGWPLTDGELDRLMEISEEKQRG